ncbi:MAG: DEAD/DEAH box helicase [Phycisphaerales bacterium]
MPPKRGREQAVQRTDPRVLPRGAGASHRATDRLRASRLRVEPERARHDAGHPLPRVAAPIPHARRTSRYRSASTDKSASETFLQLEPGDIVVHTEHGIARFAGLRHMAVKGPKQTAEQSADEKLRQAGTALGNAKQRREARRAAEGKYEASGRTEEFLTLEFAKRAKLHVPVTQIDKVQKYVGGGGRDRPPLSVLGGKKWQAQKDHVKESVKDLAAEMLRVQAARESMPGIRFPADTPWQTEFEEEFPYDETEDQLSALGAIKRDMGRTQPMDRLLCGDVGYGKTEVAIRAAFKAAEFGKQVAVLVPTTILAEQHGRTFSQRFADYPFRVETLNRFKTRQQQNEILKRVRTGQVDVLIGTHRILSGDVKFSDLGLVIVDEEQKFGVEDKNKLLQLKLTVDVLTLSATPIPRTLHMSMLGLRDISSLSTPPMDRRAVVTEVIPHNTKRIRHAIERELAREGQVYFVHNRVHNIKSVADDIRRLVPDARIVIGHGQMPERELEEVMRTFMDRRADILVSTTIIESGIDIPTANTMLINDAHMFGLADLHQLRGRVGRYKHRAYCYLLLPPDKPVPDIAKKRLRDRGVFDARCGLQDRDARSRDPRGRKPARRRTIRTHLGSRLRYVLQAARSGREGTAGRADRCGVGDDREHRCHRESAEELHPVRRSSTGGLPASRAGRVARSRRRSRGRPPAGVRRAPEAGRTPR